MESVISTFSNQSFRSQSEDTGEDRAFIKINGDNKQTESRRMCKILAKMSVDGIEDWKILPLTLPITYGRYKSTLPKVFQTMKKRTSKYEYMYDCDSDSFQMRQKQIAEAFTPLD